MTEVEGPDGHVFEFEDGTPEEVISRVVRAHYAQAPAAAEPGARPRDGYNDLAGGAASYAHGATFGAADEIAGFVGGVSEGAQSFLDPRRAARTAPVGTPTATGAELRDWGAARTNADPTTQWLQQTPMGRMVEPGVRRATTRPQQPQAAGPEVRAPNPVEAAAEGFRRGQDETTRRFRDDYRTYQERSPLGRIDIPFTDISIEPTELAGGVLSPLNRFLPGGTVAEAGASGAGAGALYTFNTGEDWGERTDLGRLGEGALWGGAFGAGLRGALGGVNRASGDRLARGPNARALRTIRSELADAGLSPAALDDVEAMIRRGAPAEEVAARVQQEAGEGALSTSPSVRRELRMTESAGDDLGALEQEFGPLSRGERTGDARMRQREDDFRRGIGSERAQRIMQAFDDRRAPEIRQNVMNIATRGKPALSDDVGSAGVTVADALRTRLDDMRQEQSTHYQRAFELAQNERVSSNEVAAELLDNVDRVIADNFLEVGPARNVVSRLQAQIQQGTATYGTVERARQALNRLLGTAMKARNDADAFAISSVIDELDAFVKPRLSAEAARAVHEARGITAELKNFFGQRQRTDLATGHTGRSDPGGRAIERVVNTDLTGEQIIDAILGGTTKPSAQTLGAVRRIREISESIQYRNETAPSGARVRGRKKVGGQTAGERRFQADSPDARFGVELPKDELQGLREGLFHRILRPLRAADEGGPRNPGGMLPAQTVVTNLRNALDGPSKEITQLMFTPSEIAAMRRALGFMQRIVPPSGTAVSGTTPAALRAVQQSADALARGILGPLNALTGGLGRTIADAVGDSATTQAARRAVEPGGARSPAQPRARAPRAISSPAGAAGVAVGTRERRRRPEYAEGAL